MPSVPWPRPEGRARHVPWPSGVGCGGGPARDHVPDRPARESLAAQVAEEDVLFVPLVVLPPREWAAGLGGGGQIAWPACGTPAWLRPRGSAWVTAGGSGQRRSVARPDNQWGGRPAKRPPHLAASAQPRHGDKRLSLVIKQKMMSESLACGDVTGSCEGPELMVAFAWTVINLHVSRHRSAVVSAATPTSGFYSASGPQQPSAGT